MKKYIWMSYTWLQKYVHIWISVKYISTTFEMIFYTYHVKWYMLTVLSSATDTVSSHSCIFCSRCIYQYTNYCNSMPKITLTVPKMTYQHILNIDTKMINVIIYDILISSSYGHWNLLLTTITYTKISTLMKFCS